MNKRSSTEGRELGSTNVNCTIESIKMDGSWSGMMTDHDSWQNVSKVQNPNWIWIAKEWKQPEANWIGIAKTERLKQLWSMPETALFLYIIIILLIIRVIKVKFKIYEWQRVTGSDA
jgi:hypothetical protein